MTGLDAHLRVTRGTFALDLPLTVAPGEVVALIGPNGAGKSTALRALAGLLPLTGGHVRLDGRALDGDGPPVPPERRRCGVVFQDHLLIGHLSARENVAFGPRARRVPARTARAAADAWLGRLGLTSHADARAATLSGGQAQRVALARALATEPDLLLLDEPFAALDAGTRRAVRDLLRAHLAERPRPVVLVTHDAADAADLADRAVVLVDGRPVAELGRSELAAAWDAGAATVPWRGDGARLGQGEEETVRDDAVRDETVPDEPVQDAPVGHEPPGDEPPGDEPPGDEPPGDEPPGDEPADDRPAPEAVPPPPAVPTLRVGVVVLAGGTARRIGGGDKTALDVGGRPILHRLLADLAPLPTVVVADPPPAAVAAQFPHATWVRESPAGAGPAVALAAGVAALRDVEAVVAVAGDQPFAGPVVPRLVRALAEHPGADAAFGVDAGGREQPLLAAYRARAVRRRLAAVRPGQALRTVRVGLRVHPVPLAGTEGLDVDDADDLARARDAARDAAPAAE